MNKTSMPYPDRATPPAAIPPDLWPIANEIADEWTAAGHTWTEYEMCLEVGRLAQERREAAENRRNELFD